MNSELPINDLKPYIKIPSSSQVEALSLVMLFNTNTKVHGIWWARVFPEPVLLFQIDILGILLIISVTAYINWE